MNIFIPYKTDPLNLGIDESLARAKGSSPNWLFTHVIGCLWFDFGDFMMKYIARVTMTTAIPMATKPPITDPTITPVSVNIIYS